MHGAAARMLRLVLYQHNTATSDVLVGEVKLPLHVLGGGEGGVSELPARFTLRDERGRPRALLKMEAGLIEGGECRLY